VKANEGITSGKLKVTDAAYISAMQKAKDEYQKALPLTEKALGFDSNNATAKQLKAACEQGMK
jgi:hypothetical protein